MKLIGKRCYKKFGTIEFVRFKKSKTPWAFFIDSFNKILTIYD